MVASRFPLQHLIAAFGLWMNRQQQDVIDYLQEENLLLKAKLGGRKIQFADAERCRLAIRAKALGRKLPSQLDTLVTPDSLLRWHRQSVAQKWNYVHRRSVGRPRIKDEIAELILRIAEENPGWGYTRILGALRNLGHQVSRGTVANVLGENGIDPAPLRGKRTKWSTFLKVHWKTLAASDFFSVEVWRLSGLTTYYVLFFIQISTRTVKIAGITTHPDTAWMVQMGRNISDSEAGMLVGKRTLIIDRDTKYCKDFRQLLEQSGTAIIRLPPRSPNLNAYAECFVGSVKSECLSRLIFFSEASLRRALAEYMAHYHLERNHQGINNRLLTAAANDPGYGGKLVQRERLGGALSYYHRLSA
jgi:transposase InsO family protein